MKRGCVTALVLALALAGGCASPAKYIEKQRDAGVVAIPNNSDAWPSYNRRAALELIQKHVGPNYEILEEREVVVGQSTHNNQQVHSEQTFNREIPFLPAEKQTINNTTTQQDITQWRIVYRRADAPRSFAPPQPGTGVAPAGGPSAGVVPSVMPAGATAPVRTAPSGTTGTGSFLMPGARPANPADCNH